MERKNRIRARKKSSSTSRLFVQQFSSRQSSKINLQKDFNVDRRKRKKSTGYSSTSTDTAKRDCPPMSVLSELDFPHEPPILPTSDPKELHNLLLCEQLYLDNKNSYSATFIALSLHILIKA